MGAPPVSVGATQDTEMLPWPAVAVTAVGGCGTVDGVTAVDGVESALWPTEFTARTVKVYATPLVRPETVVEVEDEVAVIPPGLEVTE